MSLEFTPSILSVVAERKIKEAMDQGQFDCLPGRGQEQKLEDLSGIPEDLRLAYIVLKNSGYTQQGAENPVNFSSLLAQAPAEANALKRLEKLKMRLKKGSFEKMADTAYLEKVIEKI
jgi:hypothetical protein